MQKREKVLLISDNQRRLSLLEDVISNKIPGAVVEMVSSANDAADKILANGFCLTILDTDLDFKEIKLKDLIKLNYASSKCLILLSKKSMKRYVEKAFHRKSKEIENVYYVEGNCTTKKIENCINSYVTCDKPQPSNIFNNLYSDIQETHNDSIYAKHKFLRLF